MKKLLRKHRLHLLLFFLRLAYRIKRLRFKRALDVGFLLLLKLKYLIREMTLEARLEGDDEAFDGVVHVAALRLLKPEIFGIDDDFPTEDIPDEHRETYDERSALYSKFKKDVDPIVQKMEEEQNVKQVLSDYWLIQHFVENRLKNNSVAQYYLSRAKKMGLGAIPLTNRDIRQLKRQLQKDITMLRDTIADRKAFKIDISTSEIAVLISAASPLFFISGYLYNYLLLGEFGVDVSKFFTLSDYISSSISRIGYTFSATVWGTIFFFLGDHSASRKSIAQISYEHKGRRIHSLIIIATALIGTIVGYFQNIQLFYSFGYFTAISLSMFLLPDMCQKYFKKPIPAQYILIFIFCFFAHLWASLGSTIDEFRYEELHSMKAYDVKLRDSLSLPTSDFVLIAANSGFFFFLDQNRKLHILRKDQVEYLKQRQPEDTNRFWIFLSRPHYNNGNTNVPPHRKRE